MAADGSALMNNNLLVIDVTCKDPVSVKGHMRDIVMIPFTGVATGSDFVGKVIGEGVDTQKISPDGKVFLSARYMLEGKDATGAPCRVFIENQGSGETGFHPMIVTDSEYLSNWETMPLVATIEGTESGVVVRIFKEDLS